MVHGYRTVLFNVFGESGLLENEPTAPVFFGNALPDALSLLGHTEFAWNDLETSTQ